MSANRVVLVYDDRESLVHAIAKRFIKTVSGVLDRQDRAHVVLTGGTVGIASLDAISRAKKRDKVDWSRVHFWWGDERWLPAGDPQRNDRQAKDALLSKLPLEPGQIHGFPASDGGLELDAAAEHYAAELAEFGEDGAALPRFDLLFLGVGPDGHIASLFPSREGIRVSTGTVIGVRGSPKPPPERLSLTLGAINSADRVWLTLAGADKASALGLALAGANTIEVPAAGAEGRLKTVVFVDQAAAAEVPGELIATEYN